MSSSPVEVNKVQPSGAVTSLTVNPRKGVTVRLSGSEGCSWPLLEACQRREAAVTLVEMRHSVSLHADWRAGSSNSYSPRAPTKVSCASSPSRPSGRTTVPPADLRPSGPPKEPEGTTDPTSLIADVKRRALLNRTNPEAASIPSLRVGPSEHRGVDTGLERDDVQRCGGLKFGHHDLKHGGDAAQRR